MKMLRIRNTDSKAQNPEPDPTMFTRSTTPANIILLNFIIVTRLVGWEESWHIAECGEQSKAKNPDHHKIRNPANIIS